MNRMDDAPAETDTERTMARKADAAELPPASGDVFLNHIAQHTWRPITTFLPTLADNGESTEQFRGLRSHIYQFLDQGPLKTILVSSGMPSEGKTFVAVNLAMSLARNKKQKVLLIDADMRSPSLHTVLGASQSPGLAEYLAGAAEVDDILQRNRNPNIIESGIPRSIPDIAFIPGGMGGNSASELIANRRIEELIAMLSPHFDWILFDSPPVLVFADAVDLARAADAVLLVARGAVTPYDVAQRAQAAFSSSRILGFVLNAIKDAPRNNSYYYYYSNSASASGQRRQEDKRRSE
jgi:protein-tyrosine kinase